MTLFEFMSAFAKPAVKPAARPVPDVDGGHGLSHIACTCSPTINFCGLVQEHVGWLDDGPPPPNACVVCLDLDDLPCERCGQ